MEPVVAQERSTRRRGAWRRPARIAAWMVALTTLGLAPSASAQRPVHAVVMAGGSGISIGGGQGRAISRRTPFFVEGGYRYRSSEGLRPWLGLQMRAELEGRASVAAVPFAQLDKEVGPLRLRPHAALPFFFAPFSLLGAEVGLDVSWPFGEGLAAVLGLRLDAFFWGSDLPEGSALVMANVGVGVEMQWEE